MSSMDPDLGKEFVPENEEEIIDEIAKVTLQAAAFAAMQSPVEKWPARRLPHPKSHGCVEATFTVVSNLPEVLKVGVFQPGESYPARIRFSNGDPKVQDDSEPDVRGMAIKLLLKAPFERGQPVDGQPHQDFLLANDKAFFSRSAEDYLEFTHSLTHFKGAEVHFGVNHQDLGAIFARSQVLMENPLSMEYYSQVPFKLGDLAVKYAAKPVSDVPPYTAAKDKDFIHKALAASLHGNSASFDFMVQMQRSSKAMPVEDATVIWPESGPDSSAFLKVATITIPVQAIGDCEKLSFNPWHSLSEHQPLGVINRIRKAIYSRAAAIRMKTKTQDLFTVAMVLRDDKTVEDLLKVLRDNGLVNAFALQRLGFVHFARFLILPDTFGDIKVTRFLIVTTFDFEFSDYVQIFVDELGEVFDQLLALMRNAPPTPVKQNREAFIEYVRKIRIPPVLFYTAYPDLSVQNILKMEE